MATTAQPCEPHGCGAPRPARLAWTTQYDGSSLAKSSMKPPPVSGYQLPPRNANSAVMPPIAGPTESAVSRWPIRNPERGERDQADRDQQRHLHPVARRYVDADRDA